MIVLYTQIQYNNQLLKKTRMNSKIIQIKQQQPSFLQKIHENQRIRTRQLIIVPYKDINKQFKNPEGEARLKQSLSRNKLKGCKYKLSDIRIQQKLRNKSIGSKNSIRTSGNLFHQNTFQILAEMERKQTEWGNEHKTENQKPKTRASTGDASTKKRRNLISQNMEKKRSKNITLGIAQTQTQTQINSKFASCHFNSLNLGRRMNDYMNLVIKNQSRNENESEDLINKIHTEGMIPHSRKLNSFERKMKLKTKAKSLSDKKIRVDCTISDLQKMNRTLEVIFNKRDSPLISNLEYKTIFGKLSQMSHSRQKYAPKLCQ